MINSVKMFKNSLIVLGVLSMCLTATMANDSKPTIPMTKEQNEKYWGLCEGPMKSNGMGPGNCEGYISKLGTAILYICVDGSKKCHCSTAWGKNPNAQKSSMGVACSNMKGCSQVNADTVATVSNDPETARKIREEIQEKIRKSFANINFGSGFRSNGFANSRFGNRFGNQFGGNPFGNHYTQ